MVLEEIKKELTGFQENILLADFTTYKIGGPAKYFFVAKSENDIKKAFEAAGKFKIPVFILGGGSNLLVSEKGFKGLVIKMDMNNIKAEGGKIFAQAGASLPKTAIFAAENGLAGLEWAAGVPGTVGGAIFGHAQAFGDRMSDCIESVRVFDVKKREFKNFTKEHCKFSLKSSIFKKDRNLIIISAVLKLREENKGVIKEKMDKGMEYRKNNHPIAFPSAGSTFVNPEKGKKTIPAAFLIEQCGLKGKKIGKAQISNKHSNFIVNLGGAKAEDVLALIKLAKQKVKEKFGINLETEIQLIGF